MGYVVQVWDQPEGQPRPATLQEAVAQSERTAGAPGARSERLASLRAALLDRWPLAAAGDDGVWLGDHLSRDPSGPSWHVGIAADHVDDVHPFLVVRANALGLHVHDAEAGAVHLADGTVFASDDRAACVPAMAAWRHGEHRVAHEALANLAATGNAQARWLLGTMYDEGGYVQCNAVVACALFSLATGWLVIDGAVAAPEGEPVGERGRRAAEYRRMLGPAIGAAADALMVKLLAPGAFHATLREAGGERDARYAFALAAIDLGEHATAASQLMPLAERGHVHAQRTLAGLWAGGRVTAADRRLEHAWTGIAAHAGDDAAMARLAHWHEEGAFGPRDLAQARRCQRHLLRRGRTAAVREAARAALRRLGDPEAAAPDRDASVLQTLRERAGRGELDAAFELACAHRHGSGQDDARNLGEAVRWFQVAAEGGHAEAQVELAGLYESGIGVPPDATQATHWYGRAAALGHAVAQCRYGVRLGDGAGIARDRRQMLHWLMQAARQRHGEALHHLGRVHAGGLGVRRDAVAAQALFMLASRHGVAQPGFLAAHQAEPRKVRRLLKEIDDGRDLVDVLGLRERQQAAEPAPAPADAPASATVSPSIRPAFRRESDEALLARFEAEERARDTAHMEAIRGAQPALAASLGLAVLSLHFFDRISGSLQTGLWLAASALAAWAVLRITRARGDSPVEAYTDAAVMFTPVFGQMSAALFLYRSWRARH
jgi:TPR repeat protein